MANLNKALTVSGVINVPSDSARKTNTKDSQTNSSDALSDIRFQIQHGIISPANTTFQNVVDGRFVVASFLWGGIIAFVVFMFTAMNRAPGGFPSPPTEFWAIAVYTTLVIAVFCGGIALGFFVQYDDLRSRRQSNAWAITGSVRRRAESHFSALSSLPSLLDAANQHLNEANQRFHENAFGPFWDSIQEAVRTLDTFRHSTNKTHAEYDKYRQSLNGYSHTFPALPNYGEQLPNPLPALPRLEQIVRLGQTNFQFATIWEQRRTREAIVIGFDTWADAISQIGARVIASFPALH